MESEDGANLMRETAQLACEAAHKAMIEVIDREIPDTDNLNGHRQIGAIITACSMLYGFMLDTCGQHPDKQQARLIAGMLKMFAAEPLRRIAAIAQDESVKVNVSYTEDEDATAND